MLPMTVTTKSTRVIIEYIQNQVPFSESEEFVVIFNGSTEKHDLKGWKLVYEDASTGAELHTHRFYKLRGSFDPGERLCVISSEGEDGFSAENTEDEFPGPHWDLFTDHNLHLMDLPKVRVRLIDDSDSILDTMIVERVHVGPSEQSTISVFIGHGRDPQWRDLKDHLQEQHGILVTAYELGPRAGLRAHPGSLIHDEAFAASRLSMMRIMARRTKAATVIA